MVIDVENLRGPYGRFRVTLEEKHLKSEKPGYPDTDFLVRTLKSSWRMLSPRILGEELRFRVYTDRDAARRAFAVEGARVAELALRPAKETSQALSA